MRLVLSSTSTPRFHSSLGMQFSMFYWSSTKKVIPWISSYLTGYILLLVMPTCLPLNSLPIPSSHRKKASLWAVYPPTLCLCWFSISLHNEYSRFNPTKLFKNEWQIDKVWQRVIGILVGPWTQSTTNAFGYLLTWATRQNTEVSQIAACRELVACLSLEPHHIKFIRTSSNPSNAMEVKSVVSLLA